MDRAHQKVIKKVVFRFQEVTKNNIVKPNPHKPYWALKKVSDHEYEVVATSYSKRYLFKKGHKLVFDPVYRDYYEVDDGT